MGPSARKEKAYNTGEREKLYIRTEDKGGVQKNCEKTLSVKRKLPGGKSPHIEKRFTERMYFTSAYAEFTETTQTKRETKEKIWEEYRLSK